MGDKTNLESLVVMINGDVYYVAQGDVSEMLANKQSGLWTFQDLRSGAVVVVNLDNVSSIVTRGTQNG